MRTCRDGMSKTLFTPRTAGVHRQVLLLQRQLACKPACCHTSSDCAKAKPVLAQQGAMAAAAEAEAALQRQLARKLGIKGAKRKVLVAAGTAAAAAQRGEPERRGAGAGACSKRNACAAVC